MQLFTVHIDAIATGNHGFDFDLAVIEPRVPADIKRTPWTGWYVIHNSISPSII